eukprot:TRINITY_DN4824_c0_g2_i13.p1 TRINITY_DN4824_c0_g2~~TRINITY_DN4824_c0_g2_i13.p1  ORF type:complete len:6279 (+),score=1145.85 TRINITY_DN4824_c0_g2_i13:60-18896(+)
MFGNEQRQAVGGRVTSTTSLWDVPSYRFSPGSPEPLHGVAAQWETSLQGCLDGTSIPEGLYFMMRQFPELVKTRGIKQVLLSSGGLSMGRREVSASYYPCIIQVAQCTLEKVVQYQSTGSHGLQLILMCAYSSLQECISPSVTLLSEQLQLQQLRQRIAECITSSILNLASKGKENPPDFMLDIKSQLSALATTLPQMSSDMAINFQHVIKDIMASLPYGKEGTHAYAMLLEYCNHLPDPEVAGSDPNPYIVSWRNIITDLLINDPKDQRRAAELLLYQIKPRDGSNRSCGVIEQMSSFDFDRFMHLSAEGIPPEETWPLLGSKQDQEQDQDGEDYESQHHPHDSPIVMTTNGMTSSGQDTQDDPPVLSRPPLGAGLQRMFGRYFSYQHTDGHPESTNAVYHTNAAPSRSSQWGIPADLIGVWYYGTRSFEITNSGMFPSIPFLRYSKPVNTTNTMHVNNQTGVFVEKTDDGRQVEGALRWVADATDLPRYPGRFHPSYVCKLSDGGVLWMRLSTNQRGEEARVLKVSYFNNCKEIALLQESAIGVPNHIIQDLAASRVLATKEEFGMSLECGVLFTTRLILSNLRSAPVPGHEDSFKEALQCAFKTLGPSVSSVLAKLETYDFNSFHPRSLLTVIKCLIENGPTNHDRIFAADGWFLEQSKKNPCVNLVSCLGLALYNDLNILPAHCVSILKSVAALKASDGSIGDPISVIYCLNLVTRHDFDGTWSWVNGYKGKCYPKAFRIHGHFVELLDPLFASGEVTLLEYSELSIKLEISTQHIQGTTTDSADVNQKMDFEGHQIEEMDADNKTNTFLTIVLTHEVSEDGSIINPSRKCGYWLRYHYMSEDDFERPSEFVREDSTPNNIRDHANEWSSKAMNACIKQLEDSTTGWPAQRFNQGAGACDLLTQTFPDHRVVNNSPEFDNFTLRLWDLATQQIVKSGRFTLPAKHHELDLWILTTVTDISEDLHGPPTRTTGDLSKLQGIRRRAAWLLLSNYFQIRTIDWVSVPVQLSHVTAIREVYPDAELFADRIRSAMKTLQQRVESHRVSKIQLKSIERYVSILSSNGVCCNWQKYNQEFNNVNQGIFRNTRILRELVEKWNVADADDLLSRLETLIRSKEAVELCELELWHKESTKVLQPVIDLANTTSPLLKAHFLKLAGGVPIPLNEFANAFKKTCKNVASLTMTTTVGEAVAFLHPPNGNFTEGKREQEQRLLTALGCSEDVVEALLEGALPLRFMLHDLKCFRVLATNPPADLKLHPGFFNGETILLWNNSDEVLLKDSIAKVQEVRAASAGCTHRVLQIIKTILLCSNLVRFTRENPEAQDAGLSSVLSNSRDLQHASFQTFLDCCNYINPFVAASAKHVEAFEKQQQKIAKGKEPGVILRTPINCSRSWDGGPGFWESLKSSFGDTGNENILAVQEMLLKTTEDQKIDELEKMIREQNGTTDKLIEVCRDISGLHENVDAALVVIHLPATGLPSLQCILNTISWTDAEYQDLVYRATLQRDLSDHLREFVSQAREVLRAFNAACRVFSEGHLEFRSRKLTFKHNEASRITTILQGLLGQWVGGENTSVFYEVCKKYPELASVAPAELVRMAELMRGVSSIGSLTVDESKKYCKPWRHGRRRLIKRGAAKTADEKVEPTTVASNTEIKETPSSSIPPSIARFYKKSLSTTPPEPASPTTQKRTHVTLEGAGEADGEYHQSLYTYQKAPSGIPVQSSKIEAHSKHDLNSDSKAATGGMTDSDNGDAYVMAPVTGGWVVYRDRSYDSERLMSSVATHGGSLLPWEMGDWNICSNRTLKPDTAIRATPDDGNSVITVWSPSTCSGRDKHISIMGIQGMEGLTVHVVDKSLYIRSVDQYSLWESFGFEKGMRIVSINNEQGSAAELETELIKAAKSGSRFNVTLVPAWIWSVVTSDLEKSQASRMVTKIDSNDMPSLALSPAASSYWRIKVGGSVSGMRIGLCTPDFNISLRSVDTGANSPVSWWLLRCGTLRHEGVDHAVMRPFKAGDIITVHHDAAAQTITFLLNKETTGASFSNVTATEHLRPVVYLLHETAFAEISPGAPVTSVMKWDAAHKSDLIEISDDGRTASINQDDSARGAVIGDQIFRGPGPHSFEFLISGTGVAAECCFGVASPGVYLDTYKNKGTDLFGLAIRPDGGIFSLEYKILHSVQKPKSTGMLAAGDRITFVLDLGAGSIEISRGGERLVHTCEIKNLAAIEGPLVPYCVFMGKCNYKCTLVDVTPQTYIAPVGDPSVVIKGSGCSIDGVYEQSLPTYVRGDGLFNIHYWNDRWCVCDAADVPVAWSNEVPPHPLGSHPLRWSVINNFKTIPKHIRVVSPVKIGSQESHTKQTLTLDKPVTATSYEATYSSDILHLCYSHESSCWVIKQKGSKDDVLIAAMEDVLLPHHCMTWAFGDGNSFHIDDRICVLSADDSVLRVDPATCSPWTAVECGGMWSSLKDYEMVLPAGVDLHPECNLGTAIRATEDQYLDSMTNQELSGWHIVESTTHRRCTPPELRLALSEAARGSPCGVELTMNWQTVQEAVESVRQSAEGQLHRIGQFLQQLRQRSIQEAKNTLAHESSISILNFNLNEAKFGQMQSKTIEGNIIDASRLPVADRRIFGLSLFNQNVRHFHILDCSQQTPPEDVRAFIVFYRLLTTGRLVLLNLQILPPDIQNEVRKAAEEDHPHKQLIAIITEGIGTDESIAYVDAQSCDVRWRKYAHERVAKLRKFESITYFNQQSGSGKSYTIDKMTQNCTVTRLDLDSTKTTMESVCKKLMAPLRGTQGLLVINVGHDTDPAFVNRCLDGLALFGKLTSASGLTVSTPKTGWKLIVEFQQIWRRPDGTSDITLLACRGLAELGVLAPYDIENIPGASAAVEFLRNTVDYLPEDVDTCIRMLALGIKDNPEERLRERRQQQQQPPQQDQQQESHLEDPSITLELQQEAINFRKTLQTASARLITRSLKFLANGYGKFAAAKHAVLSSPCIRETRKLVAVSLIHEMRHFVNPSDENHFHLDPSCCSSVTQFSGETPPEILEAYKNWDEERRSSQSRGSSQSDGARAAVAEAPDLHNKPLGNHITLLAIELGLKIGACSHQLSEKNYVLIPDFLQKLLQVTCHVRLCDPAVLQGPSGTGKSCAVNIVTELMQLPLQSKTTGACRDIAAVLEKFLRSDKTLKKQFPNNISDQVGDRMKVLWNITCARSFQQCVDCFDILVERKCFSGLHFICRAAKYRFGPMVRDTKTNSSLLAAIDSTPSFKSAVDLVIRTDDVDKLDPKCDASAKVLRDALVSLIHGFSKQDGGLYTEHQRWFFSGILKSTEMEELVGSSHDVVVQILNKNPHLEAKLEWARDAVRRAGANGAAVCQLVREHMRSEIRASPLLKPSPELLRALAGGDGINGPCGEDLARTIELYQQMKSEPASVTILMRYGMTPAMLFDLCRPTLERALLCPAMQFLIMIDEMNATNMLGLIKRIAVDKQWDTWEDVHPETGGKLPQNVAFIGAVNPAKKDQYLEGMGKTEKASISEDLDFDVTPMPASLTEHIVPWKQLAEGQRELFISRLILSNRNLFTSNINGDQINLLGTTLLHAHRFVQSVCIDLRATVSQRDIHRAMKIFDFFFLRRYDYINFKGELTNDAWVCALSSMILGIAVSYYYRLSTENRAALSEKLTSVITSATSFRTLPEGVTFAKVAKNAVSHFCNPQHLSLPDAVYAHRALLENLFVQMVCFENRLAVILHGPPGTSKTLSNNIIRDNMTGRGEFWKTLCYISEVCRYQGSSQSSAEEIRKKCQEAYNIQKSHDAHGHRNKRCLLFVDEAGLVKGEGNQRKWALKVLHYYLEGANIASVLMTNQPLDPAISNRCIEVYMAKPQPEELSSMCAGILHRDGIHGMTDLARSVIPACCSAFHSLLSTEDSEEPAATTDKNTLGSVPADYQWWFGLRDLFHMMRYIRRYQHDSKSALIDVTPDIIIRSLERNFNGPNKMFDRVLEVFGNALGQVDDGFSADCLRKNLRCKLDVIIDSIHDNNRASEHCSGRNLNDMWVRFKLLVDDTDDGSALQLLRQTGIEEFQDAKVLSLSAVSQGDELMPVTVVSQITAAMETGKTVWLTNTREIDACLFDVFNQSYVVASNGRGEILHFVAVAVGAALEYKKVHRDFQCIVQVTKKELQGKEKVLPSPFLNRLEKFTISVSDVLQHAINRLTPEEQTACHNLQQRLQDYESTLTVSRCNCLFSDCKSDTFDSLLLEALQSGSLMPIRYNKRLKDDSALSRFLYPNDNIVAIWRSLSTRLLQLMQPEGMLLAQRVLKDNSPCYLRAFFRDLEPWSLTNYFLFLSNQEDGWSKSVVYSPANVDFPSLLKNIPRCRYVSVDTLIESERGQEFLKESLYSFCSDTSEGSDSIFAVIISPESIGQPEYHEMQHILDTPPDEMKDKHLNKAVVLLQVVPAGWEEPTDQLRKVTPLFGTGWDNVYIDAAAENVGANLMMYIDLSIAGKIPPRPQPEWRDMETVVDQALNALFQAQTESKTLWVDVPPEDPAAALYDLKRPFGEQVSVAKRLLEVCPIVRKTLLKLYRQRLPTPEELIAMAVEVASHDNPTHSLVQRLLDEELKAPTALVSLALRLLCDDRNASVLLSFSKKNDPKDISRHKTSDDIIARVLHRQATHSTFDHLRRMRTLEQPPLFVGASSPSLPGSHAIQEYLQAGISAIQQNADPKVEAAKLQRLYSDFDVIELIHSNDVYMDLFFRDCIKGQVMHNSSEVCVITTKWVHRLVWCLHWSIFERGATVWSAVALCATHRDVIKGYVLSMLPLAATTVLTHLEGHQCDHFFSTVLNERSSTNLSVSWVANTLSPMLLKASLPLMSDCLSHFLVALSCVLSRVEKTVSAKKHLSTWFIAAGILRRPGCSVLEVQKFVECSDDSQLRVDIPSLEIALEKNTDAIPAATIELADYATALSESGEHSTLRGVVIKTILKYISSSYVSRGFSCRALRIILPLLSPEDLLSAAQTQFAAQPESVKNNTDIPPVLSISEYPLAVTDVFIALFDVFYDIALGLNGERLGEVDELAQEVLTLVDTPKPSNAAGELYHKVRRCSVEQAFISSLSRAFIRTVDDVSWEPEFIKSPDMFQRISKVAKSLLEEPGFVCPERGSEHDSELIAHPTNAALESNQLTFIKGLEQGTGIIRGMGTKAMLEYLRDQVSQENNEPGPIIKVCGEGMRHKCQNAESLATRPGDLPFVYKLDDPLYDSYVSLQRQLTLCSDEANIQAYGLTKVISKLEIMLTNHKVEEVRLLVFYVGLRCFFGEGISHPLAKEISVNPFLKKELSLSERQQRLLHIAYDRTQFEVLSQRDNKKAGVFSALLKGFAVDWTETMCAAWAVAASLPETFFGSLLLSVEDQKDYFIPGDRTGGAMTAGGNYKFDCVTQLDESGNLDSYANKQPVLSTGACYLLWGIEFGLLALQLAVFPETLDTLWHYMFSSTLHLRPFGYQRNLSNYIHMLNQVTERSMAYHLHMGTHTGLSVDEAQRMFAYFCYHLVVGDPTEIAASRRMNSQTREDALAVEKIVERFWKDHTTTQKSTLSRPQSDMCHTLRALTQWIDKGESNCLVRSGVVLLRLDCLGGSEKPRLLDLHLHEKEKLRITAPLIINVLNFSWIVHKELSGKLLFTSIDDTPTSYSGVMELLREQMQPLQYEQTVKLFSEVKTLWNSFRKNVGPIDFECQEGGINIDMDLHNPMTGAVGLPDTLDFWITESDSSDPSHKNLIKAALLSLIDKHNRTLDVLAPFTIPIDDVDPMLLDLRKPDLFHLSHETVYDVARSFVPRDHPPQWDEIESEVSFSAGLFCPKFLPAHLPSFVYASETTPMKSAEVEQMATALLALQPDRHLTALPPGTTERITKACISFTEAQVTTMVLGLMTVFKARNTSPDSPLYQALSSRWEQAVSAFASKSVIPLGQQHLQDVLVCHLRALLLLFVDKMERTDWLTMDVSSTYKVELGEERISDIDGKLAEYQINSPLDVLIEELQALLTALRDVASHTEYLQPDLELGSFLEDVLMWSVEGTVCSVLSAVPMSCLVDLTLYIKRALVRLRKQQQSKTWSEEGADLSEKPHFITPNLDYDSCDNLGVALNDDLVVVKVQNGSPAQVSGLKEGVQIASINNSILQPSAVGRKSAEALLKELSQDFDKPIELSIRNEPLQSQAILDSLDRIKQLSDNCSKVWAECKTQQHDLHSQAVQLKETVSELQERLESAESQLRSERSARKQQERALRTMTQQNSKKTAETGSPPTFIASPKGSSGVLPPVDT